MIVSTSNAIVKVQLLHTCVTFTNPDMSQAGFKTVQNLFSGCLDNKYAVVCLFEKRSPCATKNKFGLTSTI